MKFRKTQYVTGVRASELEIEIRKLECEGWVRVDITRIVTTDRGTRLSQMMTLDGEAECTHEFQIQTNRKLCYLCLHEEPL